MGARVAIQFLLRARIHPHLSGIAPAAIIEAPVTGDTAAFVCARTLESPLVRGGQHHPAPEEQP